MDIGTLTGIIEIDDQMSEVLESVIATLEPLGEMIKEGVGKAWEYVSEKFKESGKDIDIILLSVGASIAGVTVAVSALVSAIVLLGDRGSEINTVADALDRFSGSAEKSKDIMDKMREGTLNTVNNFTLMKNATSLLSANVKLSADDFGTLAQAAIMLKNQGLGPTEQMLNLVSRALQTGNAKMLEAKIGQIDLSRAQADYAKNLGVSEKSLTAVEKVESRRVAILAALKDRVSEAGVAERDFGEQLKFIQTQAKNLFDDISAAVASSAVLKAGMDALADAIGKAFGYSNKTIVETTVKLIERFVIILVDVGIAAVETARVFHVAWSALKTVILGIEAGIVATIAAFANAEAFLSGMAASIPGATAAVKAHAAEAKNMAVQYSAMSKSLDEEVKEAARGVVGASQMDKTFDKMGGTLFTVRDAMIAAENATDASTKALKKHGDQSEETARQSKEAAAAALKFAESLKVLTGEKIVEGSEFIVKQLKAIGDNSKILPSQLAGLAKQLEAGAVAARHLGQAELADELQRQAKALNPLTVLAERYKIDMTGLGIATSKAADFTEDMWEQMHRLYKEVTLIGPALKNTMDPMKMLAEYKPAVQENRPDSGTFERDWTQAAGRIGDVLGNMFEGINNKVAQIFKVAGDGLSAMTKKGAEFGEKLTAGLAMAASILSTILGDSGGQVGGAAVGALSGAAAGAGIGTLIAPGIGTAVGAGIGALVGGITGWIAAGRKAREAAAALSKELKTMNQQILDTYGSAENLTEASMRVGRALIFSTNMTAKQTEAFKEQYAEMERRYKLVDAAINKIVSGTNAVVSVLAETSNKVGLDDLSTQALATFAAVYKATGSFAAALKAVTPMVTDLAGAYKKLGIEADNVYLKNLMILGQVQKNAPQLIGAIDGQTDAMQGMAQMGMLNEETFGAMQRTGLQLYQRLQAETSAAAIASGDLGDQTRNALIPMQGYLHEAAAQAALLNIPLDAGTQMLIDQSHELGIWKDQGASAMDKLIDGMTKIVGKLDTILEKIFHVTDALNDIPDQDVSINVNTNYNGPGGVPTDENGEPIYRATGGMVPKGTDTVPAMLTPGERVLSVKQNQSLEDFLKNPAATSSRGGDQVTINVSIKSFTTKDMQEVVENDVIPIITGALKRGRGTSDFKVAIK